MLIASLLFLAGAQAQTTAVALPAGTRFHVRLQTPVNTKTANSGYPVEAILIAPLSFHGSVTVPVGTRLSGRIADIQRHRGVSLQLTFDTMTLPGGSAFTVPGCNTPGCAIAGSLSASFTKSRCQLAAKPIGLLLAFPVVGAGIGAAAGNPARGAGTGGVIALVVLIIGERFWFSTRWENFNLKRGRKMWLRLGGDWTIAPPVEK